jgi:thiol-disulfide isomerase/thioredoxin
MKMSSSVSVEMYHANWCGFCKSAMGGVIELQRKYHKQVDIRVMPSETPPPGGFRSGEGFPTFIVRRGNKVTSRFSGAKLERLKGEIVRAISHQVDMDATLSIINQQRL